MAAAQAEADQENVKTRWSEKEMQRLIDLWEKHYRDFQENGRNHAVYQKIAEKLNKVEKCNPPKSGKEVSYKIKKLKSQYRHNLKKFSSSTTRCPWRYYYRIKRFIQVPDPVPAISDNDSRNSALSSEEEEEETGGEDELFDGRWIKDCTLKDLPQKSTVKNLPQKSAVKDLPKKNNFQLPAQPDYKTQEKLTTLLKEVDTGRFLRLNQSVSNAFDEATAALTRMRSDSGTGSSAGAAAAAAALSASFKATSST